jgi:hypothetical protein
LHTHTTASDGGLTPGQLVARAVRQGIEVLAITDHDTTEGVPEALAEGNALDLTVVPGVEISTTNKTTEIHLLGYWIDLNDPDLQSLLVRTRKARRQRAKEMLTRLCRHGLVVEWERVLEHSAGGGSIGRPHIAASLLEAGHVSSYDEAFNLWIGRGCPAYVERYKLEPEETVHLVKQAGGLPVLAHPYVYSRNGERKATLDLNHWLPRLQEAGLEGIEVYYPNYPRHACRRLLSLAVKHKLLITGGSDFHGGLLGNGLGSVAVPWAAWEGLERRHWVLQADQIQGHRERRNPAPMLAPAR